MGDWGGRGPRAPPLNTPLPQATHHAKFDFDPTTCVVWANSQFATQGRNYIGLGSPPPKDATAPSNWNGNRFFCTAVLDIMLQ